jgi:hypothetical protein
MDRSFASALLFAVGGKFFGELFGSKSVVFPQSSGNLKSL